MAISLGITTSAIGRLDLMRSLHQVLLLLLPQFIVLLQLLVLHSSSPGPVFAELLSGNNLDLTLGLSVGVPPLLLASVSIGDFVPRRSGCTSGCRCRSLEQEDPMMQFEGKAQRFSYEELSEATGSFSKELKLRQGGFGSVHRGLLRSSGIPVVVKKINSESTQGEKEFMAEVSIISRLRHRILIQLLGWCKDASKGSYLLVYELMLNGSLDKVLFGSAGKGTVALSWEKRFNVLIGTAAALDHLHHGWKQQVIHRDVNSSNIMLDENWNAKLGAFGLARLVDHERTEATSLGTGTSGYIAPEVSTSGKFTEKTDVFDFSAVVLEVACGRKSLSGDVPPDEMILVDWVWRNLSEGHLLSTVDKCLRDYDTYWMEVLLIVGLLCSHPNPLVRPSMRHVVILAGDAPVPSVPASKPALLFTSDSRDVSIHHSHLHKTASRSTSRSRSISLVSTNVSESTGASMANSNSAENPAHRAPGTD